VAYLRVEDVGKTYDNNVVAVSDVNFEAGRGEFLSVVGPSGCGKSTLLRVIAGLRTATTGSVFLDGKRVDRPIRVGMVFQTPSLMAWRTALGNVLAACSLAGLRPSDYRDRAEKLLELTALSEFRDAYPSELSGGMQQRVALCRALIHDPDLLLMDEPFGALDAMTRDDMSLELLRVLAAAAQQKTVLFVTHSIQEAIFLSDRILVMSARPGRIIADLPSVLDRPRTIEMRTTDSFVKQQFEVYQMLHARNSKDSNESA
jgi:NitT/TauT family transport system ATP-binding protein